MDYAYHPSEHTLRTPRLLLRPLCEADAPALLAIYSDPEVTAFYELETMSTLEQAERALQFYLRHHDRFALVDPLSGVLIGSCGLFLWDPHARMANVGYDLAHAWWGKGLMREALTAVLAYGFAARDLHRVNAFTAVDNARSIRLLRGLGFVEEGLLHDFAFWKGGFHDMRAFGLLRAEARFP